MGFLRRIRCIRSTTILLNCVIALLSGVEIGASEKNLESNSIEIESHIQVESQDQEIAGLDLEGLIDFAKKNSDFYKAARQNIEIAYADLVSAGLLSNPQVSYSQTFIGGRPRSEAGAPEYAPAISFEVDLFGKRGKRKDVAERGVLAERHSFSDFDRLFKFRLKQVYREFLLYSEQIKYKKEFFDTYLELMKASKIRASKGDVSGIEYDRLDLERIGYEADYRATELQLVEVSQKMRRLLGLSSSSSILPIKGVLEFVPLSKIADLKQKLNIDRRPDLAALLAKVEQSDEMASLKRREVLPTFTLGGEYRFKSNEHYPGLFISMPLPIFNRNQGEILKAVETSKKLRLEVGIKRLEISTELQTRISELEIREKMLLNYQELELLEKNKSVAERSRFAYLKKAYSIVALLESQRNYMNVQKNYYEQLYYYYTAIDGFLAASEGTHKDGN